MYLPSLFCLLLIYGFDSPCVAGLTVIAALIHECGHGVCLMLQKNNGGKLSGHLTGFRISKKQTASYLSDAIVYAAGPLANFAASALALVFIRAETDYVVLFSIINLSTATSNLLPIKGYDGYDIVRSLLCLTDKWNDIQPFMDIVSLISITFILILSLYIMARIGDGYWTAGLFILSLIKAASEGLKRRFS